MIARPTADPALIQSIMDRPEVAAWLGHGDAVEAYLRPNTTFLVIYADERPVAGAVADYYSDTAAQVHNLYTDDCRGRMRIEALRAAMCWGFGPGGLNRVVGETDAEHKRALRFAVSMAGMTRLYEAGGKVWTAMNVQDWPWRHADWCQAPVRHLVEPSPLATMLGAAVRLTRVGAAYRGAQLYNEWAVLNGQPLIEVIRAAPDGAALEYDRSVVIVTQNDIEVRR